MRCHIESIYAKRGLRFARVTQADALGQRFLDFFQLDRNGRPKGVVRINLEDLP